MSCGTTLERPILRGERNDDSDWRPRHPWKLLASGAHVIANPGANVPSLGASGAVAAVLGAYVVMFPRSRVKVLVFWGFFVPIFFGRRVVVAPVALGKPTWDATTLPVDLSKEQIEARPEIDLDVPISNRVLSRLHNHYGWPAPWTEDELLGKTTIDAHPRIKPGSRLQEPREFDRGRDADTNQPPENEPIEPVDRHLRSANEILGYHIAATDGRIGHVEDLLIDGTVWVLRYLLVDTHKGPPGRQVLISTDLVTRVGWTDHQVQVDLSRDQIKDHPEYDPQSPDAG